MTKIRQWSVKTKKILWILCTIAAGILWFFVSGILSLAIGIIAALVTRSQLNGETVSVIVCVLLLVGLAALIVMSVIIWKRIKVQCPSCGKLGAMEFSRQEYVGERNIYVSVSTQHKNLRGETVGTGEQYVPGVERRYKNIYKCKFCNYESVNIRSSKMANI